MPRKYISKKKREAVTNRAKNCCEYCLSQAEYAPQKFTIEHIKPISKDGTDELHNLALSCQGCNSHKYNKIEVIDPITEKLIPIYNPRVDNWADHFRWNEDCTLIIGITPTGRGTVSTLDVNRDSVIRLRNLLILVGEHPPEL